MSFIIDRFTKCRVADGVYKDEGEVDKVGEEEKKEYALFKIIDLIKEVHKDNLDKQGDAMDKLKNITNRCDSIIEKRFGLSDYLFKQKVLTQTYYDLHIDDPETFENNTFGEFFEQNGLLTDSYINDKDKEAIIFKLYSTKGRAYDLYIRLSRKNLKDRQSNESLEDQQSNEALEENPVKIFEIDIDKNSYSKKYEFRYLLITNQSFVITEEGLGGRMGAAPTYRNINKILINDKTLADIFNKKLQQTGGIGKKTIKTKSKPLKNTILQKKEIFGKDMRIYKINGSKKKYVKYKGNLISVSDYKKIIKLKKN